MSLRQRCGLRETRTHLRSSSRVLRPRQFQEIKEVMKSSHLLLARSQKTKSALSWPTSAHLEQVGWPRQTVFDDQISGTESNRADLECMVEQGNGDMRPLRTVGVQASKRHIQQIRCRDDASRIVQAAVWNDSDVNVGPLYVKS
ncbi:hypothetical protein TNCV_4137251 [Trichonephila clavipes]|nr:hypothetical protein TNCV_4137251 [Trichonephila clavipes]